MGDYTTVAAVKADLPDSPLFSSTDASYDAVIGSMITAASRLIDREIGRWPGFFYPSTDGDTTRYFDGGGEVEQIIDEMVSLTSIAVAESGGIDAGDYTSWTVDSDFYVWPYNYADLGQPIQALVINRNGSKGRWPCARKAVKVTGIFGYSYTPPSDIAQACKIQAMRWFMRAKQGYQDAGANAEIGQMVYVQQLDPDIREILRPYQIGNMV